MSTYELNKALWTIYTSAEQTRRVVNNPSDFAAGFDLTDDERTALQTLDYRALLTVGAHPFLMFKTALRTRAPMNPDKIREYVDELQGLELRDIMT
ncbi:hypothetical protein [Gordonia terrae]|uniref:hypothetical protein n=1 Tax=Gordonia terrae TaxID=2055 RepID=UPI003F6CDEED